MPPARFSTQPLPPPGGHLYQTHPAVEVQGARLFALPVIARPATCHRCGTGSGARQGDVGSWGGDHSTCADGGRKRDVPRSDRDTSEVGGVTTAPKQTGGGGGMYQGQTGAVSDGWVQLG